MLTVFKQDFKIDTIIRYYDDTEHPTIPGKPLRADEFDAIIKAGFKIGVVFQHKNGTAEKFQIPGVGAADAKIALDLADENRQPYDTAIYFGLDGPFPPDAPKHFMKDYFVDIVAAFKKYATSHGGHGYDVGIYCSPDMCSIGDDLKLKYLWLSPAGRGSDEYHERFYKHPETINLLQSRETFCSPPWIGVPKDPDTGKDLPSSFDFDQINSMNPKLGTWNTKR